ncbi:MAG TPA: methylated-DNA--[protein]-cysteine S-methyltransferase [Thermomicrobiales bacterium]|nr:methylated-DNA--[protein]-cysteine S-methyltransferase [Thermomicrobiales bacterium]
MTNHRYGPSDFLDTPVGQVMITVTGAGLAAIDFVPGRSVGDFEADLVRRGIEPSPDESVLADVLEELTHYFAGELRTFTSQTDLTGISDFTRRVIAATAEIPYGETHTYGEIAQAIGSPGATQAVGNALGANPVPIVIPCHRVIRGDGSMGWYTGGQPIKRTLLGLEGVHFPVQRSLEM